MFLYAPIVSPYGPCMWAACAVQILPAFDTWKVISPSVKFKFWLQILTQKIHRFVAQQLSYILRKSARHSISWEPDCFSEILFSKKATKTLLKSQVKFISIVGHIFNGQNGNFFGPALLIFVNLKSWYFINFLPYLLAFWKWKQKTSKKCSIQFVNNKNYVDITVFFSSALPINISENSSSYLPYLFAF